MKSTETTAVRLSVVAKKTKKKTRHRKSLMTNGPIKCQVVLVKTDMDGIENQKKRSKGCQFFFSRITCVVSDRLVFFWSSRSNKPKLNCSIEGGVQLELNDHRIHI
ncbi:hypothetical protein B9Z55_019150 [Caenorhabditis nigoni]|uniref:Uncharacterized protein n=1 Tax=Caenorhabditis nigoni TaxID=1611254 RepID=A0A2G5TH50_9PELO|nr:hypothetical protein B9Z55_019150 [Caenorhabditis nigoni]